MNWQKVALWSVSIIAFVILVVVFLNHDSNKKVFTLQKDQKVFYATGDSLAGIYGDDITSKALDNQRAGDDNKTKVIINKDDNSTEVELAKINNTIAMKINQSNKKISNMYKKIGYTPGSTNNFYFNPKNEVKVESPTNTNPTSEKIIYMPSEKQETEVKETYQKKEVYNPREEIKRMNESRENPGTDDSGLRPN